MLWLKAFHLITMVTWFAGIFYLPRLFVYHAMADDETSKERFKIMQRKLYWGIMTPSGVLTLILGSAMLMDYAWAAWGSSLWLHIKLGLITALVVYHLYCGKLMTDFRDDKNHHSHKWYRWFNEIPVIMLVAIILLAVLKPA
ncbi:MAG: protoporphyrinogen oxidase HemJ [gamma proteobacterium symbiont of Bathyaustriella thionipta]|nr:protoporphyrinogen oxidase HemJ [gamma proteobacterium symbiont of Bathyaustriella thionipta]